VSQEALYRGEESDGLANVIFSVASNAKVTIFKFSNRFVGVTVQVSAEPCWEHFSKGVALQLL
jgi:hypothetical protein